MVRHLKLISLLSLIFIFHACQAKSVYIFYESLDNIVSIKIVDIENNAEFLQYVGDFSIIEELGVDRWDSFLSDFKQVPCYEYWNDPQQYICGKSIMVTYSDDTVEVISSVSSAVFPKDKLQDSPGSFNRYYFDKDLFYSLISKYT